MLGEGFGEKKKGEINDNSNNKIPRVKPNTLFNNCKKVKTPKSNCTSQGCLLLAGFLFCTLGSKEAAKRKCKFTELSAVSIKCPWSPLPCPHSCPFILLHQWLLAEPLPTRSHGWNSFYHVKGHLRRETFVVNTSDKTSSQTPPGAPARNDSCLWDTSVKCFRK